MYTKAELLNLYNMNLDDLLKESQKYLKNEVEFCSIISARTGKCSQNCKYCAQSSHYNTEIETHPLLEVETVLKAAQDSVKNGANRVAIVTSGKTPDESDFDVMLDMIKTLNKNNIKGEIKVRHRKTGDKIIIDTRRGHKSVTLISNGVTSNILNYMAQNSKWLNLIVGDNIFSYEAAGGSEYLTINIALQPIYEGM